MTQNQYIKHRVQPFMVPKHWHNCSWGRTMVLVLLLMQLMQQAHGTRSPSGGAYLLTSRAWHPSERPLDMAHSPTLMQTVV